MQPANTEHAATGPIHFRCSSAHMIEIDSAHEEMTCRAHSEAPSLFTIHCDVQALKRRFAWSREQHAYRLMRAGRHHSRSVRLLSATGEQGQRLCVLHAAFWP